uniref:Uncharacterized protein n=1 Tax=Arundo donax TaxID=35708 RepID=A0A0A9B1L8_ARUDO
MSGCICRQGSATVSWLRGYACRRGCAVAAGLHKGTMIGRRGSGAVRARRGCKGSSEGSCVGATTAEHEEAIQTVVSTGLCDACVCDDDCVFMDGDSNCCVDFAFVFQLLQLELF